MSALHAVLFSTYDLIHVHHIELAIILPLLRLKYKVLITAHGSPFLINDNTFKYSNFTLFLLRFSESKFCKFANMITTISKRYKYIFEKKYKKEIYFIPNGVNKIDHEGVKNLIRGVGRIIRFSHNDQFLAIFVQSVIFASFHLGKEGV